MTVPCDLDAERIVLGAMMLSPAAVDEIVERLTSSDFYEVRHASIYAAIVANAAAGADVGPIAIGHTLSQHDQLGRVGGGAYLHGLIEAVPTVANVGYYSAIVADQAFARRADEALTRAKQILDTGDREKISAALLAVAETTAAGRSATGRNSWSPVDLGPYLRGEVRRPEPSVGLARSDGLRLLYPGKEHAVVGEMEAGKGWYASGSVAAELAVRRPVLYVHFEESDPSDTVERLLALGATATDLLDRFRFVGPESPVTSAALERLLDPAPSLVVYDGVNEAMSLHGWGIRDEDGAAAFRRHLVMPAIRVGAATLSCDHVVKNVEQRGRNALGSVHKGNGLSGVLIMLENADPFGRGQRGRSHVFVTKDRPGHLRRNGRPTRTPGKTFMGELVVDDTQLTMPDLDLRFWAPAPPPTAEELAAAAMLGDPDESAVLQAVQSIIAKGGQANLRAIRALAGLGKDKVDGALERLVFADVLAEHLGPRRARVFTVARDQLSEGSE